ncbi:hypothetical protein F4X73_17325 [Candidatus Poribacteria bacterium]|nr:hypothetical protein [Candidatus Poribacteria bacterium]
MRKYLFLLSFICALNVSMGITTVGYEDNEVEIPELLQTFLKKEGISIEELKSNPQLINQWKQDLYRLRSKQLGRKQMSGVPQRNFAKDPLDSYYQVIIDNNIFRPLGYKKYKWTLKLELIGIMTYADSSRNRAIILSNHPKHRRLTVKIGDTFLERTVTRVEARKVSYTDANGKEECLTMPSLFGGGTSNPKTEGKK